MALEPFLIGLIESARQRIEVDSMPGSGGIAYAVMLATAVMRVRDK
jgi:hypothetical protein